MRKHFAIAACLFSLLSCSNNAMTGKDEGAYNKQKQTLLNEEKKKPLSFLKVYASNRKNIWGSTVVKGAVSNTATVCSYQDIRLKLLSFDKGRKPLEEHEDVIDGPLKPNDSKDFKLRYHLPRDTDSVSVSVMSATISE